MDHDRLVTRHGTTGRHHAPRRHRGRHRAPLVTTVSGRGRCLVVVGAALAAAGTVAMASAAALPAGDDATAPVILDAGAEPAVVDPGARADRDADRPPTPLTAQAPERVWHAPLTSFDLSSLFGARWGVMHRGLDFAAPEGAPVLAAFPGVVVEAGWNSGGFGRLVVIDHGDGITTWYAHNSTIRVEVGETVHAGQRIADVGNTGNSFGPHSHFEVRRDGLPVDPLRFLADRGVDLRGLAGSVLVEDGPRH